MRSDCRQCKRTDFQHHKFSVLAYFPIMSVVLVTGAASGIGKAVAEKLVAKGDSVVLMDTNKKLLEEVTSGLGESAAMSIGSVSSLGECKAAVETATERFGGLDGVSHNAGIQRYGTALDTKPELWEEVIAVNLTGGFFIAQASLPHLLKTKGCIVFMGSVQSLATQQNVTAYTAAKHGLLGLTKSIAMDYALRGVRANLVAPGAVRTPMLEWAISIAKDQQALWKTLDAMHPVGRIAEPGEIANVVVFLLSDKASFMTGEVVKVDGGLLTQIAGTPD